MVAFVFIFLATVWRPVWFSAHKTFWFWVKIFYHAFNNRWISWWVIFYSSHDISILVQLPAALHRSKTWNRRLKKIKIMHVGRRRVKSILIDVLAMKG